MPENEFDDPPSREVHALENVRARLLSNTSALVLNQAILVVSSFAIAVPLARSWGASSFGRYGFAIAFSGMFAFAFDWGLNWLLTREVARDRENVATLLGSALGLTVVLSLVTMVVLISLITTLGYPTETVHLVYLAGVWTLLEVLSNLFIRGTFYAFEKMWYETPALLAERLFAAVAGLVIVARGAGLIALMLVLVASRVIKVLVCTVVYMRRIGSLSISFNWRAWPALVKATFPFGLTLALRLIISSADITLLSLLTRNEADVGFYRSARTLTMYWPVVGLSLTTSLFPQMSTLYMTDRQAFVKAYQQALRLLVGLAVPLTLGLALLADRFILLVYGEEFSPATIGLRILSLSVLLILMYSPLSMVLTASNKQVLRMRVMALAAVGNIVLNLLLIPRLGYLGACIATMLTDGLILAGCYWLVSKHLSAHASLSAMAPPAASGLIMGLWLFALRRLPLPLLIPSAAAVYLTALFALDRPSRDRLVRFKAWLTQHWFRAAQK